MVESNTLLGQFMAGTMEEMEHTGDRRAAVRIALDHLAEDRGYYTKLKGAGLMEGKDMSEMEVFKAGLARMARAVNKAAMPDGTVRQRRDGQYRKVSGEWVKVPKAGPRNGKPGGTTNTDVAIVRYAEKNGMSPANARDEMLKKGIIKPNKPAADDYERAQRHGAPKSYMPSAVANDPDFYEWLKLKADSGDPDFDTSDLDEPDPMKWSPADRVQLARDNIKAYRRDTEGK